jgi:hypothetical protein
MALNPKLPDNGPTTKEVLQGAGWGAGIGLGLGTAGFVAGKYLSPDKIKKMFLDKTAARLTEQDIEERLGPDYDLNDEEESFVRRSLGQHRSNSFILRNPNLTGIPTLGLAPAIKQHLTKDKIVSQLVINALKQKDDKTYEFHIK